MSVDLSRETLELARQALGALPAGHPARRQIARALDEIDAALDGAPGDNNPPPWASPDP